MYERLPSNWETPRITITDMTSEFIPRVQQLYEASKYIGEWDGNVERETDYISKCYREGDLPPNGTMDNYKIQMITMKQPNDDQAIGYFSIYHGFPTRDTVYISFMFFDKNFQQHGYASEVVQGLLNELTKLQYRAIRLNVALKN